MHGGGRSRIDARQQGLQKRGLAGTDFAGQDHDPGSGRKSFPQRCERVAVTFPVKEKRRVGVELKREPGQAEEGLIHRSGRPTYQSPWSLVPRSSRVQLIYALGSIAALEAAWISRDRVMLWARPDDQPQCTA